MTLDLTAHTGRGGDLLALAEFLAGELADRAAQTDRDASSPFGDLDTIRLSGFFTAQIPEELGGLGVANEADVIEAASRLARYDELVGVGVDAHLAVVGRLVREHTSALIRGAHQLASALAAEMQRVALHGIPLAEPIG